MKFHNIYIIIFIIFIIYIYQENKNNDLIYVMSTFDNKNYLVRNKEDNLKAANLLAKIRNNIEILCQYLKKEYNDDERIHRLLLKFDPNSIIETSKNSKYTSYSVNKGEKIVLCLRSRDNKEELIDENTLMFVSLHEIAHIMTKSVGHKPEFWKNFKFLLQNAIKINIYKHENYNNHPKKYCGIMVTDTPLNDTTL